MKVLVWILLAILIYWAVRSQIKRNLNKHYRANAGQPRRAAQPSLKPSAPAEKMVACTYCQIYLPRSEAVHVTSTSSDDYFCSEEHVLLYSRSNSEDAIKKPSEPRSE